MHLSIPILLGTPIISFAAAAAPSWTMESMSVVFCAAGTLHGCGDVQTTLDFVFREVLDGSPSSTFTDTECGATWVQPDYPTGRTQCGNSSVSWEFVNATSAPVASFSMAITKETQINATTKVIDSTSFHVKNNSPGDPESWLGCVSPPTGQPTRCSMDSVIFGHGPVQLNVTETYSTL